MAGEQLNALRDLNRGGAHDAFSLERTLFGRLCLVCCAPPRAATVRGPASRCADSTGHGPEQDCSDRTCLVRLWLGTWDAQASATWAH